MKTVLLILGGFLLLLSPGNLLGADSGEIPFRYIKGKIIIPVQIDEQTYQFLIDTGGLLEISQSVQNRHGFVLERNVTVTDINRLSSKWQMVRVPVIEIGQMRFEQGEAMVSSFYEDYPVSCFEMDGMLGRDFLNDKIVQIDYQRRVLRITDEPGLITPDAQYKAPMRLSKRDLPAISIMLNGQQEWIEFDAGAHVLFSYQSSRAKKIIVRNKSQKLEFAGLFSFGVSKKLGRHQTQYRLWLNQLQLGSHTFGNFYSDYSKKTASRLGSKLIEYGQVTLDYPGGAFYYKPYALQAPPQALETFGFGMAYLEGKYQVKWVLKGSEAAAKGVKVGDEVMGIDPAMPPCEGYLQGWFDEEQEQWPLQFRDRKTGKLKQLTLNKQRYRGK